jgi:hypothetical protein
VRWPSAVRPDLGGHAEYALREFLREDDTLVASTVDQTPDVAAIQRSPTKRAQLIAWLRDPKTLAAIDLGWAQLPSQLAAPRALSVSPRGLGRRANRPFRQLLTPRDIAALALPLAQTHTIATPEALLRRLDDHACVGCHQSQTIAGFHLLGEDDASIAAGNALAVSLSPPLVADRARRAALLDALATSDARPDLTRPSFERQGNAGGRGAHCGLGDAGFAAWTCNAGLVCAPSDAPADDAAVGECQPPAPDQRVVGDACELGAISPSADPRRDAIAHTPAAACGADLACDQNRVGFPGGMCTRGCEGLAPPATCGVIADLTPFNTCLARGRPFPECLAGNVDPAALRACDEQHPCRDDYVCAREPSGAGGCTPPYFLFQLRVDGHPPSRAITN